MISLTELVHIMKKENEDGLINIDNWRWPDVEHLVAMGFEFGDDYRMHTNKSPEITIYKKKESTEKGTDGKPVVSFYIEEKGRETKRFKTFNDVIDFFDTYVQPELDQQM